MFFPCSSFFLLLFTPMALFFCSDHYFTFLFSLPSPIPLHITCFFNSQAPRKTLHTHCSLPIQLSN
ncbi:hypothetical protein ACJW30_07G114500 [Castanea mollissima]